MTVAGRRSRHAVVVLLFGGALLYSLPLDDGLERTLGGAAPSVLDAPKLTVGLTPARLVLQGTTASAVHESGLRQIVVDQFGDRRVTVSFTPGVVVPEAWITASLRLLYALGATESASAIMLDHHVTLRGITSDPSLLDARLDLLRAALPADAVIERDVIVVDSGLSLDKLCRLAFATISTEPVGFRESSAELRSSSYATLDRVVDFAFDCRDLAITVIGHSDGSGDEVWNRRLSRARAQAIADYLIRGGIAAERIAVEGRGSAAPIADNRTAHGRSLNRRIEFELR